MHSSTPTGRNPRKDAVENRERLVAASFRAFARDGIRVPVAEIAAEAGLGVATFYRCFRDRADLMAELETRAYAHLNDLLDQIEARGSRGLTAIEGFLLGVVEIGDELILPLHGAPPLRDEGSVAARQRIDARIEDFLGQARATASVSSSVNATDIIMYSALVSRPLRHGPNWNLAVRRQIALFMAGVGAEVAIPGPSLLQSDIEEAFGRADVPSGTAS